MGARSPYQIIEQLVNTCPCSELERISHVLASMDSWPMLERCWRRQWAGLDLDTQRGINEAPFEVRGLLGSERPPDDSRAIWTVGVLALISVKTAAA